MSQVRVLHMSFLPLFCLCMPLCLHLVGLVQFTAGEALHRWNKGMSVAGVPWWLSSSIPHQSRWWSIIEELDMEGCTPVSYPSGLAIVFQFCEQSWWSSSLLSTGIYGLMSIPPPDACKPASHSVQGDIHTHYTLLEIFNHLQWMFQLMSKGEVIASHLSPQGSLSSLMLGVCQTIILLWHCLAVIPLGSSLDWGGAGTPVPCLVDTHT